MALTVLKKTRLHCVVAVTGGAETIDLDDTLLIADDEVAATPKVHIAGLTWSIPGGTATIERNSVVQWTLGETESMRFNGWSDNRNETFDIVVTPPAGGTVILELAKVSGYGQIQHPYQGLAPDPTTTTTTVAP